MEHEEKGSKFLYEHLPTTITIQTHDAKGQAMSYQLVLAERLGKGGFGEVYRAHEPVTESPDGRLTNVAVKFLTAEASDVYNGVTVDAERFMREARIAAGISHPNVIRVLHLGVDDTDTLLFVMEYVRGAATLTSLVMTELRKLPPTQIVFPGGRSTPWFDIVDSAVPLPILRHVFAQILDGVSAVHAKNIIHRDLKPENVLLMRKDGKWIPKIADLGIARNAYGDPIGDLKLTRTGTVICTPRIASPEQILAASMDFRVDIWALGCMLYEMVTGAGPFDLPSELAAVAGTTSQGAPSHPVSNREEKSFYQRVLSDDPTSLSVYVKNADRMAPIERVIRDALARQWQDRIVDVDEFKRRFLEACDEVEQSASKSVSVEDAILPPVVYSREAETKAEAVNDEANQPTMPPAAPQAPAQKSSVVIALGLVVAAIVGVGVWFAMRSTPAPAPSTPVVPIATTTSETAVAAKSAATVTPPVKSTPPAPTVSARPKATRSIDPSSPEAADWKKATDFLQHGKWLFAITYAESVLQKHPDFVAAKILIGDARRKMGKPTDACQSYAEALEYDDAPPLTTEVKAFVDATCVKKP